MLFLYGVLLQTVITIVTAQSLTPEQIAAQYGLTASTTLAFPQATPAGDSFISSSWGGKLQMKPEDLEFVPNPFPSASQSSTERKATNTTQTTSTNANPNDLALQVTYPAGSFSHDTGGSQFYSALRTQHKDPGFQSMLLSYEVAFPPDFDWVMGGKLPGLRGGNESGCSGGRKSNGVDCFTTRLMWRENGQGEVYAYIGTPNGICKSPNFDCNDIYGISISRGSFTFATGQWNRISLLIALNSPGDIANGHLALYVNDQQVISQNDLYYRSSLSLNAGGLFFSTFFGGSDSSWSTPSLTHTYYRNIRLWGGSNPSNLTGAHVNPNGALQGMKLSLSLVGLWWCSLGATTVIGWLL